MKNRLGHLLFFVTVFTCMIVLFGCVSMKTQAASATLPAGESFNNVLRKLVGSVKYQHGANKDQFEQNIEKIVFTSKNQSKTLKKLPNAKVGNSARAYYDKATKTVYINTSSAAIELNADCKYMFSELVALKSIDWGTKVKGTNLKQMQWMFHKCESLKTLDLSRFTGSKVTSMYHTFDHCSSLESMDLSHFKTKNNTSISNLFNSCTSLKSVNLSGFNTANVVDMEFAFYNCTSLTSIDISTLNTAKVELLQSLFYSCQNLESVTIGNLNAPKARTVEKMFFDCQKLKSIDLSGVKLPSITNTQGMFKYCYSLTDLNLSMLNMSKVKNADSMIEQCTSLKRLDLSKVSFKVPDYSKQKYPGSHYIIAGIPSMEELNLSGLDYSALSTKCADYRLPIAGDNLKVVYSPRNLKANIPVCKEYLSANAPVEKSYVFVLDDNADGIPDNSERYINYLPAATDSHRYLANYRQKHNIEMTNDGNGLSYASEAEAAKGDLIYILAIPSEGFRFKQWKVISGGVVISNNYFRMVDSNVKIKAIFEPISSNNTPAKPEEPKYNSGPDALNTANEPEINNQGVPVNTAKTDKLDANLKGTKFTKITTGNKKVTLKWKKQAKGTKGYEIQYSTDKSFNKNVKSVTISKSKTTSRSIKKLKSGRKYYFRIRTYKKSGSEKIYSNWSKTKSVRVR